MWWTETCVARRGRRERLPHQRRRRTPVGGREQRRRAVVVDVGVARARRVVGDDQSELGEQQLVVGQVRGAAGLPVDGVEQVDVAGAALADPVERPGSRCGRRPRSAASAGGGRSRPAGSGVRRRGRRWPRTCRAGSRGRGASPPPSAGCRCPGPGARGSTANDARIHISSRTRDTAPPTTSPSTSATQQPPGSVTSAVPGAAHPGAVAGRRVVVRGRARRAGRCGRRPRSSWSR